jgi:hypothetical protein
MPAGAEARPPVNLASSFGRHGLSVFRWSMRSWASVRRHRNRRHGFPRSHGPPDEQLALQRLTLGKRVGARRPRATASTAPARAVMTPPARLPGTQHQRRLWPVPGGVARSERHAIRASNGGIGRGGPHATPLRRSGLPSIVPTAQRTGADLAPGCETLTGCDALRPRGGRRAAARNAGVMRQPRAWLAASGVLRRTIGVDLR